MQYKVEISEKKIYFVEADSPKEAERMAYRAFEEGEEVTWYLKDYR